MAIAEADSSRSSSSSSSSSTTLHVSSLKQWAAALHAHHRPLLVHLNADTTWLVQLPYPASVTPPRGRTHYNVLFDPWLAGPQSDVASWFSTQWHVVPPGVASMAELNDALREVEGAGIAGPQELGRGGSLVDVVAICHEFTDHCHKATLLELPADTPVFASELAAELIRGWSYFDRVLTLPVLSHGVHWSRLTGMGPLPGWLGLGRLETMGNVLYYHSAILVAFDVNYRPGNTDRSAEAIIYSPHGIESQDLANVHASDVKPLALLHGMDDVRIWLTKQLNLGALNGIRAVGASRAKYWVATHDEVKMGGGLVAPFLMRTKYTFTEAVAHEQAQLSDKGMAPEYVFKELGSGDGMVLV